jgi:hypothetical protein
MDSKEEDFEVGIVDLEEELISALDELDKDKNKNRSIKNELVKLKEGSQNPKFEEDQHMIMNLKFQVEEAIRIDEACKSQLEEKQCLEAEILAQSKEAEKREESLTSHIKERYEDLNKLEA